MSDRLLSNIKKILIIRNDGIGDLLNSTPAIALLRRELSSRRDLRTRPTTECAGFNRQSPRQSSVGFRPRGCSSTTARTDCDSITDLHREEFDLAVAMRTASWSNFVTLISGARYRLGRYHKHAKGTFTSQVEG